MNGDAANDSPNNPDSRPAQVRIAWGLDEDALLRPWLESPLTHEEAARLLPHRSPNAVRRRLKELRAEHGINLRGQGDSDDELRQRRKAAERGSAKMIEAMRKAGFCAELPNTNL